MNEKGSDKHEGKYSTFCSKKGWDQTYSTYCWVLKTLQTISTHILNLKPVLCMLELLTVLYHTCDFYFLNLHSCSYLHIVRVVQVLLTANRITCPALTCTLKISMNSGQCAKTFTLFNEQIEMHTQERMYSVGQTASGKSLTHFNWLLTINCSITVKVRKHNKTCWKDILK